MAGEGFGWSWKNQTGEKRWDGPGAFSACLVTPNKSMILNPEPFLTKTNLDFSAVCRASGINIPYF